MAGRVLHVRADVLGQQMDILAVYQVVRVAGSGEDIEGNLRRRSQIWRAVECLAALPLRSAIMLAGDFNTAFVRTPRFIGGGVLVCRAHARYKAEATEVLQMLQRHGLQACSAYGKKRPTYVRPLSRSHIDYVFVRKEHSDRLAKCTGPVGSPIAAWRTGGRCVLQGTLSTGWKPWQEPPEGAFCAPALPDVTDTVAGFWNARSDYLGQDTATLRACFDKLWKFTRMQKLRRVLRARSRKRKKEQALMVLQQAEEAARKGNSKQLYTCIRFLAGGRKGGKLRLRDSNGQLVGPDQECDLLADYAAELFYGSSKRVFFRQSLPLEWFSYDSWKWAIAQLRGGKAVPDGQPRIQVWKEHPDEAAQRLCSIAEASLCSSKPFVPLQWCEVEIAWLPKPGKPLVTPLALRSVGLTAADTKAFLVLLKKYSTAPILESMWDTPQFAYRPHVDTYNAILHAVHHCRSVRDMQRRRRSDHTSKLLETATQRASWVA